MLIKSVCVFIICFCSWFLGNVYSETLHSRIKLIDRYILLLKELKSNVYYSGKNIYDFLAIKSYQKENKFCAFLLKNKEKGFEKSIKEFITSNEEEKFCINTLYEAFVFLENSSDAEGISELLKSAIISLEDYKKQIQEEYKGKIKITPFLFLLCGLFIALVII